MIEALAISRARGAERLMRLGDFDIWRGKLAEMRGDRPLNRERLDEPERQARNADALLVARALDLLDPECRDAIANLYEKGETNPFATECERLLEISMTGRVEQGADVRDHAMTSRRPR